MFYRHSVDNFLDTPTHICLAYFVSPLTVVNIRSVKPSFLFSLSSLSDLFAIPSPTSLFIKLIFLLFHVLCFHTYFQRQQFVNAVAH